MRSGRDRISYRFEGHTTVEYTLENAEPGAEITLTCRVRDDLGGEGMKATKLKVE